ncbi:hypothetical protein ACLBKU_09290 [Erythrobacter sp. NE805]|uniref:hypothetical protein n=1 Tax=Erythrobacter sp. NE805 TaxID=3389875 RepID=UPI00396B3F82
MRDYDNGDEDAAILIAGYLYTLTVNRGRNSISLLSQSGLDDISFTSIQKNSIFSDSDLIVSLVVTSGRISFQPTPNPKLYELSVVDWLEENIWCRGSHRITRRQLIETVRDKEGFGHFDRSLLSGEYLDFLRNAVTSVKWATSQGGTVLQSYHGNLHIVDEVPEQDALTPEMTSDFSYVDNIHHASLRQMANEVMLSLLRIEEFSRYQAAFWTLDSREEADKNPALKA